MSALLKEIKNLTTSLRDDECGATMIEYSVLISLITVLIIVTIGLVGEHIQTAWVSLEETLAGAPAD